ncbi:MAG: T9SS type A sorting domain-containing protein [Bacteroidota bacterium]
MKNKTLLFILSLAVINSMFTQQSFFDDFESYTGNRIGPQSERWTTWSGNEGGLEDPFIIPNPAFSGVKSLEIKGDMFFPNGGPVDCILKLGDQTSGLYEVSFQLYFEDADGMYYNFQHFEIPGEEWAFEVSCPSGGVINGQVGCELLVGGATEPFTMLRGEWSKMAHIIDLDNDEATLLVNDIPIHTWPFSWQFDEMTGTNQLGGINFFPRNDFDAYVIDDVNFSLLTSVEDQQLTTGQSQLVPNVVHDWATLSLPHELTAENIVVSIWGMDGQLQEQFNLNGEAAYAIDLNNLLAGSYFLVISTNQQILDRLKFVKL